LEEEACLQQFLGDNLELEIINVKHNPLKDEDIKAIVSIELHPDVRKWLPDYAYEDFDKEFKDYKKFFQDLQNNNKVEVLVARVNGRIVGFLALWRMVEYEEHVRSIGVSVHPDYRKKGIATKLVKKAIELAKELGAKKLIIETLEENIAMRRVAEKLKFKLEYVRRSREFKDGSRHNEYVYLLSL